MFRSSESTSHQCSASAFFLPIPYIQSERVHQDAPDAFGCKHCLLVSLTFASSLTISRSSGVNGINFPGIEDLEGCGFQCSNESCVPSEPSEMAHCRTGTRFARCLRFQLAQIHVCDGFRA